MIKKLFLVLTLLFTWSCVDNDMEEEYPMKLWLNGEEIDVESVYQQITTFGEQLEYYNDSDSTTYTKKIFIIHFQKEDGRVELNKEHYAVVFTDWEGSTSNSKPIDEGSYQWPAQCPICVRLCICDHGAESKWVRMEIVGDSDVAIMGTARLKKVDEKDGGWIISGNGEGTFYNPYIDANMKGKIEFTNLEIKTDSEESPYYDYGGR